MKKKRKIENKSPLSKEVRNPCVNKFCPSLKFSFFFFFQLNQFYLRFYYNLKSELIRLIRNTPFYKQGK